MLPLSHLRQLIQQKYSFPLGFTSRFHYPYILFIDLLQFLKLIRKNDILHGKHKSLRVKVIPINDEICTDSPLHFFLPFPALSYAFLNF